MDNIRPTPEPFPGPQSDEILSSWTRHRALAVHRQQIHPDFSIRVRRPDKALRQVQPHRRMIPYLRRAGFYGVFRLLKSRNVDNHLITALVERWRQETHTFHLPVGEATITLQDVEVILGLPIDGEAVIGYDYGTQRDWPGLWEELLGFAPAYNDIIGLKMRINAFQERMTTLGPIDDNTSELQVEQYARMCILIVIGGYLLPDTSGARMPLYFLDFVSNLDVCRQYSWGSAVLACLYRYLCKSASDAEVKDIGGCTALLQYWAWERIEVVRPLPCDHELSMQGLGERPLGARWRVLLDTTMISMHSVSVYRDQLSQMNYNQFIWEPYSNEILNNLPQFCVAGQHLWRSVVPLIAWEIVEWHLPHRVLRQFGLRQLIPRSIDTSTELHSISRSNNYNIDWRIRHSCYMDLWGYRAQLEEQGEPWDPVIPDMEYLRWFQSISVFNIGTPFDREGRTGYESAAGKCDYALDAVARIAKMCVGHEESTDIRHLQRVIHSVRDEAVGCLLYLKEGQRLNLAEHPRQDDRHPMPNVPPPARRTGRSRQAHHSGASRQTPHWGEGSSGAAHQEPHWGEGSSGAAHQEPHWGEGSSGAAQQEPHWGEGSSGAAHQTPHRGTGSSGSAQRTPHRGAGSSGTTQQMSYWATGAFDMGTSSVAGNQEADDCYRPNMEDIVDVHKWRLRDQPIDDDDDDDDSDTAMGNQDDDDDDDADNQGAESQDAPPERRVSERILQQRLCPRSNQRNHKCGANCPITPAQQRKRRK